MDKHLFRLQNKDIKEICLAGYPVAPYYGVYITKKGGEYYWVKVKNGESIECGMGFPRPGDFPNERYINKWGVSNALYKELSKGWDRFYDISKATPVLTLRIEGGLG